MTSQLRAYSRYTRLCETACSRMRVISNPNTELHLSDEYLKQSVRLTVRDFSPDQRYGPSHFHVDKTICHLFDVYLDFRN